MERVKLYCSPDEDTWEDKGTGYLKFESASEKPGFILTQEEGATVLLTHEIGVAVQGYTLQEDSRIIRWADPTAGLHHALSFEDGSHCRAVYENLQKLLESGEPSEATSASQKDKELPQLTLKSLEEMTKMFEEAQPFARDQLFAKARASDLIPQLVDVFQQSEDLEDRCSLENCCRIARNLVIHADFATADELFSENNALSIIGALEYDPDIPVRIKHREYLKERVHFKEVVPISDPDVIQRIHRIYRMQYVKDVVLPRLLDEPVFSCLSHLIVVGNMEVVTALSMQSSFFQELFSGIKEQPVGSQEWRDLVGFLQEYCCLLRQLQPSHQIGILLKMSKQGLFPILTEVLRGGSHEVRLKVIDILNSSMGQDPSALRSFLAHTPPPPLLGLLIDNLIQGDAMGLTEHSLDVIKLLLEPSEDPGSKYDAFMEIFYGEFIHDLVDALAVGISSEAEVKPRRELPEWVSPRAKGAILELLIYCIQTHTYTIKYCLLRGPLLKRALGLLGAKEKWLVASTVRFFRAMAAMKDEFYDRMLIRANVLGVMLELLLKSAQRNNLLNSTILELFDFIRREHRHDHISHIVEKYHDQGLSQITYVKTFQELQLEYDKKKEGGCSLGERDAALMNASPARMKRDSRAMEKEEEEYFAEGSDDTDKMEDSPNQEGNEMEIEQAAPQSTLPSAKRLKGEASASGEPLPLQAEDPSRQT